MGRCYCLSFQSGTSCAVFFCKNSSQKFDVLKTDSSSFSMALLALLVLSPGRLHARRWRLHRLRFERHPATRRPRSPVSGAGKHPVAGRALQCFLLVGCGSGSRSLPSTWTLGVKQVLCCNLLLLLLLVLLNINMVIYYFELKPVRCNPDDALWVQYLILLHEADLPCHEHKFDKD